MLEMHAGACFVSLWGMRCHRQVLTTHCRDNWTDGSHLWTKHSIGVSKPDNPAHCCRVE